MTRYIIDAEYEIENIVSWIKAYFVKNGPNAKAVIGISGGKDSTIAAALLCKALGPDRVVAVMMPCGEQKDIEDSIRVCKLLQIPAENQYTINIKNIVDACYDVIHNARSNSTITTNTPARIRMTTLYMVAAQVGGRVCNTSNASESYIGYCTKYGDLAGDFAILKGYYVRDVLAIGHALGIPYDLVEKDPSDGMCGSTDEANIGFTYETLDAYLIDKETPNYYVLLNIEDRHERNLHKGSIGLTHPIVYSRHPEDEEWKEGRLYDEWRF